MDLSQGTEFCQQLLYFFENFVFVWETPIKSWFNVTTTQMFIFVLSVSAGVLLEGTFSLWVSSTEMLRLNICIKTFKHCLNNFKWSILLNCKLCSHCWIWRNFCQFITMKFQVPTKAVFHSPITTAF